MSGLLEDLYEEHRVFLGVLDAINRILAGGKSEEPPPEGFFPALRLFFEYVGHYHHEKEEGVLFPLLDMDFASDVGGGNCPVYFTPRVFGGPFVNPNAALCDALGISGEPAGCASTPFRAEMKKKKSMLMIPIEDHALGALASEWILAMEGKGKAELYRPLKLYGDFLRAHIEREDNCLFLQVEKILGENSRKDYRDQSERWNQLHALKERLRELPQLFAELS